MAYAQLGTTIFDGYKSFVTFAQEEGAILVEHALIGRKPRLEGSGLSLRVLTLTVFLHAEFCTVEDEITKFRNSKDTFEILPLLWGNGKVEGSFVIETMTSDKVMQDSQGNTYAALVNVVLKESVVDNLLDQQQQAAQKNAFAVNKQPATKSKRVNPPSCQKQFSNTISRIRGYGAGVNTAMAKSDRSGATILYCENIVSDCVSIITGTNTTGSCIFDNDPIRVNANNVKTQADNLRFDTADFQVSSDTLKSENILLQSGISSLVKAASPIIQKAIIP
jgi:phage protein U